MTSAARRREPSATTAPPRRQRRRRSRRAWRAVGVTSAARVAFFGSGAHHRSPSAAAATSGSRPPAGPHQPDGWDRRPTGRRPVRGVGAGLDVQWEEREPRGGAGQPARRHGGTPQATASQVCLGWDLGCWYTAGEPASHGSCLSGWPTAPWPPLVQVFFFSVQNPKC